MIVCWKSQVMDRQKHRIRRSRGKGHLHTFPFWAWYRQMIRSIPMLISSIFSTNSLHDQVGEHFAWDATRRRRARVGRTSLNCRPRERIRSNNRLSPLRCFLRQVWVHQSLRDRMYRSVVLNRATSHLEGEIRSTSKCIARCTVHQLNYNQTSSSQAKSICQRATSPKQLKKWIIEYSKT